MLEAILKTLSIMGWLGIILTILVITNTVTGMISNIWSGKESFSLKRMFKGLLKSGVFYISAIFVSIAFTMLPFINEMITDAFGVILMSSETLNTLSSVGVLAVVIAVIITQAKKAIENVVRLANTSSNTEQITWPVEIEEEDIEEK